MSQQWKPAYYGATYMGDARDWVDVRTLMIDGAFERHARAARTAERTRGTRMSAIFYVCPAADIDTMCALIRAGREINRRVALAAKPDMEQAS